MWSGVAVGAAQPPQGTGEVFVVHCDVELVALLTLGGLPGHPKGCVFASCCPLGCPLREIAPLAYPPERRKPYDLQGFREIAGGRYALNGALAVPIEWAVKAAPGAAFTAHS